MNEKQKQMWDALCELDGEDVARVFTNYYGNQLLSEDFHQFLVDEGYIENEDEE